MLTVPGLKVASDWEAVHDRLLDDFPRVTDVLATTMTATLLIVHEGDADVDAWLEGISDAILSRRLSAGNASRVRPERAARSQQRDWGLRRGAPLRTRPPRFIPVSPLSPTNERHSMSKSDVTSARSVQSSGEDSLEARWRGVVGVVHS
jgi:hypothetical protein